MSYDDGGIDGLWYRCLLCGERWDMVGQDERRCPGCGGAMEKSTAPREAES